MVHAVLAILVVLVLAARGGRADLTPRKLMDVSLRMPEMELLLPVAVAPRQRGNQLNDPRRPTRRPRPRRSQGR